MKDFIKKTWIVISSNNKASDLMINCTRSELDEVLLNSDFEDNEYEVFLYKSDEYYMLTEGEDYDINKNYKNEKSR